MMESNTVDQLINIYSQSTITEEKGYVYLLNEAKINAQKNSLSIDWRKSISEIIQELRDRPRVDNVFAPLYQVYRLISYTRCRCGRDIICPIHPDGLKLKNTLRERLGLPQYPKEYPPENPNPLKTEDLQDDVKQENAEYEEDMKEFIKNCNWWD